MKKLFLAFTMCMALAFGQSTQAQTSTSSTPAAQAPAPTQESLTFSFGATALGLAPSGDTTPASDIVVKLGFTKRVTLRSDNLLAPGANLQYYGGGMQVDLPNKFLSKTVLAPLQPFVAGTIGADRIVPASGPSQSHISFMAGGGLDWTPSVSVRVHLIEVDVAHFPGAPWGANTPAVSGGISMFFGKQ